MASEKTAMADLEDLNRTLYDIGAQDLLDVWEAMETQDDCINSGSHSVWNSASSNSLIDGLSSLSSGPVLKDRLLTDTMLNQHSAFIAGVTSSYIGSISSGASANGCTDSTSCTSQEDLTVNAEHSYSLGGSTSTNSTFGSDGDSMPESPLSLDDDMETECYPCIPMHSASNQKRMNHSTITMIKTEPLSEDVNVDVDDESTNSPIMKQQNSILQQKSQQFQQQTKQQNTRKTTRNQIVQQNNQNQLLQQQQQQNQQNQFKAAEASRVQQHTIRLSRPKHPQSLLKQKPVTHTILVTTAPSGVLTTATSPYTTASATSPGSSTTKLVSCSDLRKQTTLADDLHASLISNQPTDGCGVLILTEEEKKTLISEGYPIPSKLPLTKAEEKSLKKIRRKIKNKISAQESRRKKKEFVDTLERKVDVAVQELDDYKKKCELLQKQNTSLRSQLKSLRTIVANNNSSTTVAPSLATPTIKPDPDCLLENDNDLDLD